MRLLLVDDEATVVGALARLLRVCPPVKDVAVATSGPDALQLLSASPFDVMITDLQMPGMNGLDLLKAVQERFPRVVRIVLSGCSDREINAQLTPLFHLHLAKPCSRNQLVAALTRAQNLEPSLLPAVREAVTGLSALPASPRMYADLVTSLLDARSTVHSIARVVSRDDAVAAKVLQVANSAWVGLSHPVHSIEEAVTYLGATTLKAVVLAVEAFRVFDACDRCTGFSTEHHKAHALLTARIAAQLMDRRSEREEAYTGGLLHDIGKLVFAAQLPEEYARVLADRSADPDPVRERRHGLPSHASVGSELLSLWGLPARILDIVARHHEPGAAAGEAWSPVLAIHVADQLAHEAAAKAGQEAPRPFTLDPEVAARPDVQAGLESWRELALFEFTGQQFGA